MNQIFQKDQEEESINNDTWVYIKSPEYLVKD